MGTLTRSVFLPTEESEGSSLQTGRAKFDTFFFAEFGEVPQFGSRAIGTSLLWTWTTTLGVKAYSYTSSIGMRDKVNGAQV